MAAGRIHNFAFFLLTFYFPNWINQFESIMQNKPNLPKAQMNVTSFYTVDYENEHLRWAGKTNPIQTQYKANTNPIPEKPKNERNFYFNKGLWKWNRLPTPPKQSQYKPNQTQLVAA